jgi:hypothetical protein
MRASALAYQLNSRDRMGMAGVRSKRKKDRDVKKSNRSRHAFEDVPLLVMPVVLAKNNNGRNVPSVKELLRQMLVWVSEIERYRLLS